MWILAVTLAVLVYFAVRQYGRITELRVALAIYATDLLLRPELHQASAARLRELIREPRDRLSTEKEVFRARSEEHTSELQSRQYLVCRLLLEKKKLQYSAFLIA